MAAELEIERKFTISPGDAALIEQWADASGYTLCDAENTSDIYFADPAGRLVRDKIALRLRDENGSITLDTKVPSRLDAERFERIEKNYVFANATGAEVADLLQLLGYTPSCTVIKERRPWQRYEGAYRLRVCIDQVASIGLFCEIEVAAPMNSDATQCTSLLDQIEAGLQPWLGASEGRSYRELALISAA
jgi:predicted adenylyl cyclase CyaB